MRLFRALAVLLAFASPARATTPCPTVTDWIAILQVFITGAPSPIANAQYDINKKYLWVFFQNGVGQFFVNVPLGQVQGTAKWTTISGNCQALVQSGLTWCPILLEDGLPLLSKGVNCGLPFPPPIVNAGLASDGGVLILTDDGWGSGSGPGTCFSNGGIASRLPGPVSTGATVVFFGQISAATLFTRGCQNIPACAVQPLNQICNASGELHISPGPSG